MISLRSGTKKTLLILLILIIIGTMIFTEIYKIRGIPFVKEDKDIWSIGIYKGTPLSLDSINYIINPVLSANNINDTKAAFVADPFILKQNTTYYLFFEVLNKNTKKGEIGLATSNNMLNWTYQQIVLKEPFHLSYPYVFEFNNSYYMVPESAQAKSVRLYKSTNYPYNWTYIKNILIDNDYTDSSLVYFNHTWYLFSTTNHSSTLRLFFSNNLEGNWTEHPLSPIYLNNKKYSRGAGRIILYNSSLIRYAQDNQVEYGKTVYAINITSINITTYSETLLNTTILNVSKYEWNKEGMHQIDIININPNEWIAVVDGKRKQVVLGWNY